MTTKQVARAQYRRILDGASRQVSDLSVPVEGWIATARKSLGMSAAQLGRRAGLSRSRISQAEQGERSGATTLKTMQALAAAMNCRFLYAIVPEGGARAEDLLVAQAKLKAEALVETVSEHMALEQQGLPPRALRQETKRLAEELLHRMPPDFWERP